jgi:two-component system sensor histidine kinase/response regulator
MKYLSLCGAGLLLLFTSTIQAKSYYATVERISVGDGLPETTVYSFAKDKAGFLWLGMPTALARFDGYQFRTFTKNGQTGRSLAVSSAGNIFIDSEQRIWLGTWGEGLVLYDKHMKLVGHFKHQADDPNSIGNNMVQVIFEDSDGDIWIGTNGGGLALYQSENHSFKNFSHDESDTTSLSHNRVWSITQTDDGIIWVATSYGINRFDKNPQGQFTRFNHNSEDKTSINHVLVRRLLAAGNHLWVGTEAGFGHFNTKTNTFGTIELFGDGATAAITQIIADNQGGVWVGSQKGLFRYETQKEQLTPLASENNYQLFPHNDIRDMLIDDAGILWVATRYAGLIKINLTSNNFSFYDQYDDNGRIDNTINMVHTIHADKQNGLWLGTGDGLLHMDMNRKNISRFDPVSVLSSVRINTIAESYNGTLWLGGPFGLLSLDRKREKYTDQAALLAGIDIKHILNLLADDKGSLWIGTSHEGLLRVDADGSITRFKNDVDEPDSISGNSILALYQDRLGRIWAGTNGHGVNRYDEAHQRFIKYNGNVQDADSLSNNVVKVIYQTKDSVMWFGTTKSLEALDDSSGKFTNYGVADGLANSNIKGLVEDDFGDLWISTGKGLSQFKRTQGHFFNFSVKDSLSSNDFTLRSVTMGPQNKLYFGNHNGFHEVQPSEVEVNNHLPTTVITDVWIDNERVERFGFDDTKPLVLDYQVKSLRLQFVALDFQAPGKNLYSHRLDGFVQGWTEPDNNRTVTYTSLNPGKYTFEVKGSNNSNQWNPHSASVQIIIESPWWAWWWIRALILALVAALIYGWNQYRVTVMAVQKAQLKREVALRTKEISAQKDALMSAHEQLNERSMALKDSNHELSQTLKRTAEYQDQLVEKEKMAALGKMVAGISHEINTPIGLGVTATTLMQDRLSSLKKVFDDKKLSANRLQKYLDEADESLGIIYRNLDRAAELISSFKQVSVDQSSDERRTFEMALVIDEVLISLKPELKRVKHKVTVQCSRDIVIKSKPGAIGQILINLINNSLIHAFDGIEAGEMIINIELNGTNCEMTYSDNGNGVAADIKHRIFEPFATTKRGAGGSGLGMHLVYNLATQALNGTIALNSDAKQGIEVEMIFPISSRKKPRKPIEELANG